MDDFEVLSPLSKQFVVNAADIAGLAFGSIFTIFGSFSILAGVLLIFLIFVMMAAERRAEMGIARAVGMQRGHLVQMFVTEGLVYDLARRAAGAGAGLRPTLMIGFIRGVFGNLTQQVTSQAIPFEAGLFPRAYIHDHRLLAWVSSSLSSSSPLPLGR